MEATTGSCEIVELDVQSRLDGQPGRDILMKPPCQYSIEDDINRLFEKIDIRNSTRELGLSQQAGKDPVRKKAMKRTIRGATCPSTGIGITEPVSLKQALRGLSISQASEMAAMKRLAKQKPAGLSGAVEVGSLKRIYRAVVSEADIPSGEGKEHFMEISLVPESNTSSYAGKVCETLPVPKIRVLDPSASSSSSPQRISYKNKFAHNKFGSLHSVTASSSSSQRAAHKNKLAHNNFGSLHSEMARGKAKLDAGQCIEINSSCTLDTCGTLPPAPEVLTEMNVQGNAKGSLHSASSAASSSTGNRLTKSSSNSSRFMKPVFRKKSYLKKKLQHDLRSDTTNADSCLGTVGSDMSQIANGMACEHHSSSLKSIWEGDRNVSNVAQSGLTYSSGSNSLVTDTDRSSRTQEKGEFSQSSKGSIGDCTRSTCSSEVTCLSRFSRSVTRPHMSKDLRWEAIHNVQERHGTLSLSHFKLLRKLGCGDIGTVYLAELSGSSFLFALKVMDSEFHVNKKNMLRAQTEREIMQILDHPFLPTLYAHFTSDKLSCLVMEYCPGGDLHVLRQKQIFRNFPEQAVRFYVAEVLLALEYLHMLGVVYRDLKPENVLVREDGHIMLSDFDLSLRCAVRPTLLKSTVHVTSSRKLSNSFSGSSCINPFCIHPSWQVPCFTLGFVSPAQKMRNPKSELLQASRLPQLVVEPTSARSNSFVGTHEYLAPEIIKGEGHGSGVDWWMLGIFLYELLYGKTPFIGSENEDTLSNVVSQGLKFPETSMVSSHARDLIRRLLIKEPEKRLGSVKGAAEIKQHSFFEGLNWALIRCTTPPEIPKSCHTDTPAATAKDNDSKKYTERQKEIDEDFDMF